MSVEEKSTIIFQLPFLPHIIVESHPKRLLLEEVAMFPRQTPSTLLKIPEKKVLNHNGLHQGISNFFFFTICDIQEIKRVATNPVSEKSQM